MFTLQDERLPSDTDALLKQCVVDGVSYAAVNGCWQGDWQRVLDITRRHHGHLVPNLGLHPYWVHRRSADWLERLKAMLEENVHAGLGECGLDRGPRAQDIAPIEEQEHVFREQLQLAAQLLRPVTIHCVQAYGRVHAALSEIIAVPLPVILHSYTGTKETIATFLSLKDAKVYFSLSGHLLKLHPDKAVQMIRALPIERMLLESDCPDGCFLLSDAWLEALPMLKSKQEEILSRGNLSNGLTTPGVVRSLLSIIAAALHIAEEHVAAATIANAQDIFLNIV